MDINTQISISNDMGEREKNKIKKLISDIEFLCRTPRGSIPLMRDFGIDYDAVDSNFAIARRKIMISATEGIRKYFGITVSDIDVTADEDGKMKICIKI